MTFDEALKTITLPGEFDGMDECDQDRWLGALEQAWKAGMLAEREECAKVCETMPMIARKNWAGRVVKRMPTRREIAAEIKARSNVELTGSPLAASPADPKA